MASISNFLQARNKTQLQSVQLELSGPILSQALETLIAGTESQGGVESGLMP